MNNNTNGTDISVEVLAERIGNVSKRLDEQVTTQKAAVDAALVASQTAISVALATQEKTVNAAFAASEKAITKAEEAQKEYNKAIGTLQNDVVSLKESRSQNRGNSGGMRDMYGWIFGGIMFLATIGTLLYTIFHVAAPVVAPIVTRGH
jgi:hypothetical protein